MRKKKIAFIKLGSFSHINESVRQQLVNNFPELDIETIDIADLIGQNKSVALANLFASIKAYGLDVSFGRKNAIDCFYRTPYIFNKIKSLVSDRLSSGEYVFSFQTQSLFDASTENIPHFLYTDHTHLANLCYPTFDKGDLYPDSWIELERKIYHNARMNFTMSSNISRSIAEHYAVRPDRIACVYGGSNAELDNALTGQKKYGNKNVLFLGVDWERKGGPMLVEAHKKVLQVHPDARLMIVGCAPKIDAANCTVVGKVPLKEVTKYYESASIFCLPSKSEPFGIVFIEALSHRLPIVATNIGAIPDFVESGDNGYLVQPDDIDRLAEVLIDLIGNPEKCRRFGEKGHRIAMDRYSWEKVGRRMKQHIDKVIKGH